MLTVKLSTKCRAPLSTGLTPEPVWYLKEKPLASTWNRTTIRRSPDRSLVTMPTETPQLHNWALQQLFIGVKEAYEPVKSELPNNILN